MIYKECRKCGKFDNEYYVILVDNDEHECNDCYVFEGPNGSENKTEVKHE